MKRPDPVMHHLIAAMLYAWSLVAVNIAWHSTALAAWLTATGMCYLTAIAAYQALQASWRAWRGRKVVPPPSATAPLWPTGTDDDIFETYVADQAAERQHAEAMAAVAAEPMQPQTPGDTAVMPTVQTGVTWGFGPTTPVVDAPPWLWTPPGRHGRERDYEPAGVAR